MENRPTSIVKTDKCDCLNFCGDDPGLYKNTVTPCANFSDGTIKNKKKLVEKCLIDAVMVWSRYPTPQNEEDLAKLVVEYEDFWLFSRICG